MNDFAVLILQYCIIRQFKFWMYYLGEAIFITTLLLKNWRIYRIFYNKRLRNIVRFTHNQSHLALHTAILFSLQGNQLSDVKLMVVILLMLLPVAAILVVWSAYDNIRFDFSIAIQDSKVASYTIQLLHESSMVVLSALLSSNPLFY